MAVAIKETKNKVPEAGALDSASKLIEDGPIPEATEIEFTATKQVFKLEQDILDKLDELSGTGPNSSGKEKSGASLLEKGMPTTLKELEKLIEHYVVLAFKKSGLLNKAANSSNTIDNQTKNQIISLLDKYKAHPEFAADIKKIMQLLKP